MEARIGTNRMATTALGGLGGRASALCRHTVAWRHARAPLRPHVVAASASTSSSADAASSEDASRGGGQGSRRVRGVKPKVRTLDLVDASTLPGSLSNRALFRATPVDSRVLARIKELQLCGSHKGAQIRGKSQARKLMKEKPNIKRVPLQMRMYPLFDTDLDTDVLRFLGLNKREKLRQIGTLNRAMLEAGEGFGDARSSAVEVAFAGRSNVGKSSLLNATTLSSVVKSANFPGVTQDITCYRLGHAEAKLHLVDLPGYGYADAKPAKVEQWNVLMDDYVATRGRKRLKRVYLVCDARHGLKQSDREFMALLSRSNVSWTVVMTKTDTMKPAVLAKRWWHVNEEVARTKGAANIKGPFQRVHMLSSRTGAGVAELTREIYQIAQLASNSNKGKKGGA